MTRLVRYCEACGQPLGSVENELEIAGLRINREHRTATVNGAVLRLSPTQFRFVELLVARAGRVIPTSAFFTLGVFNEDAEENTLRVYAHAVRSKLAKAQWRGKIVNVYGAGYTLVVE